MSEVRVGVLGVGRMGQRHCRVYSGLRRARLMGICDVVPEVGHRVAQQFDVPFYESVEDLLEHVDAVSLCDEDGGRGPMDKLCAIPVAATAFRPCHALYGTRCACAN